MNREDERRGQAGEETVSDPVMAEVPHRATPPQGEHAVYASAPELGGLIPYGCQIGQQARVPEEEAHREVGEDRRGVPRQRALELRPDVHGRRVRDHPVREPRPPEMQEWIEASLDDGEQRHRLREAIDARAPSLLEEEQN